MKLEFNGKHLMVDVRCFGADGNLTPEQDRALRLNQIGEDLLQRIVEAVDMTMILPPISINFPHSTCEMHRVLQLLEGEGLTDSATAQTIRRNLQYRVDQSCGYSTILMIAESHISLHTFPSEGFFTFDCYSCKEFDEGIVKTILENTFGPGAWNIQCVSRTIPGYP